MLPQGSPCETGQGTKSSGAWRLTEVPLGPSPSSATGALMKKRTQAFVVTLR